MFVALWCFLASGADATFVSVKWSHIDCDFRRWRQRRSLMGIQRASYSSRVNADSVDSAFSCWSQRSRFWETQGFSALDVAGFSDYNGIGACGSCPSVVSVHSNTNGEAVAVQVEAALSEEQASRIQALAGWVRQQCEDNPEIPRLFQHRSFGESKGGNDCTYLAPLLQIMAPDVAKQVVSIVEMAYERAEWGALPSSPKSNNLLPHPKTLGIRTSEHLLYDGWRNLEAHKDIGSVYTIMIALKDPKDYDGGAFFWNKSFFEQSEARPPRLSAIVFRSDTTHGVRPITCGIRESFVTELWDNDDAPLGMNRPTPEQWEKFLVGEQGQQ